MKQFVQSQNLSGTRDIMAPIHYKVKEEHRYTTKAAYVVLGFTMNGRKDILGSEHESSKFRLNILNVMLWIS